MNKRRKPRAVRRLAQAETYAEWCAIAQELDCAAGKDEWKAQELDSRYDYRRIRNRLDMLQHARETRNNRELLFALNEGIHGNLGGIANPALYDVAHFGTKDLITDYMSELERGLEHLARVRDDEIPFEEKHDFFRRASHCYGRTALMLSGAGSLTPFHFGVVKALHAEHLLPKIISGSSGGAIIAAIVGTQKPRALNAMLTREWIDENYPYEKAERRGAQLVPAVSVDYLNQAIENGIPDVTFEEAFELSGMYINISVATSENHHRSRLLNVITTPHVYVREAVRASCAVPGVFPAVQLAAKDFDGLKKPYLPEFTWIDGAISDDLPARRLARLYGVNHFVASQTNPLVLWAINDTGWLARPPVKGALDWAMQIARINLKTTRPVAEFLSRRAGGLRTLTHTFYSLALQEYLADVTILPTRRLYNPRKLLAALTEEEVLKLVEDGERSTWPHIERIRNSTRVSRRLDLILHRYDEKADKLMSEEMA